MVQSSRVSGLARFLSLSLVIVIGAMLYFPAIDDNVGWYNSAEFNIAALTLDVPHAPGYPLFTRLASLAIKYLPGDSPARKINLFTATTGIAAAAMLTLLLLVYGCSSQTAILGGIFLLAFPGFRDQSIMAEVYALEVCLIAAGLIAGLVLEKGNTGALSGVFAGLVGALGVGHRPTFGLYTLTLIFFIWQGRKLFKPGKSFWLALTTGICIGLLPSIDLYQRLQNPARVLLDPLIGQGFSGFLQVFTGTVYGGGLFVFGAGELFARLIEFLRMVAFEGGIWLLIGPLALITRKRSDGSGLKAALVGILAVNLVFVLNYNAFEAHTMLMPAFMALAALAALAVELISKVQTRTLACLALGSTAVFCLFLHPPAYDSPEAYVKKALGTVPEKGMVIMSNDVEFKPYWYFRLTEGFRTDLAIQLVDRFTTAELAALKPAVLANKLYGSLIYPTDSLFQLTASYSIAAEGYLHRVIPGGNWQATTTAGLQGAGRVIFADAKSHWSDGQSLENLIKCPADTFNYHYSYTGRAEDFARIAVVTLIVDGGGLTLGRHGLMVGHDLHFPARYFCREGRPESGRFEVSRSIALPEDLAPGNYSILTYVFRSDGTWPTHWLDVIPENVSIFNIDGFLEVFALRYGLACRPLVKHLTLQSILSESSLQPVFESALKLAEFRIQKAQPL
ncbi:MAG: DUF2723 domain-containing protein [Candidatus Riflebacteria bacterium]|nr:DUF2723 domain-containing protein [Candidatus Riflebacteria bacterium]